MSTATEEILRVAADWAAAMISNDAEAIASFMAEDWVIVSERGISTRAEFLPFVESGDLTHDTFNLVGDARVRVYGGTAVLSGRVTNTGHFRGEPFTSDEWTTDAFVQSGSRWRCVLSQITPVLK